MPHVAVGWHVLAKKGINVGVGNSDLIKGVVFEYTVYMHDFQAATYVLFSENHNWVSSF